MSTEFQYEAIFRVNLAKAIPEVGDMVNRVNNHLAKDGYSEQLSLTHEGIIPPMVITSDRELTEEDQYKMKTLLEAKVIELFPKYDVRLASFRRKSGNVSQSVS